MKRIFYIFLLVLISCGNNNESTDLGGLSVDNFSLPQESNTFVLPTYNGLCLFTENEAYNDLTRLRLESNLDFEIIITYRVGPAECLGKVWGANLDQGATIDAGVQEIILLVGKEDLNNLSRTQELPNEYGRTVNLGNVEATLFQNVSSFQDYITDIDYFPLLDSYFLVGHSRSTIYMIKRGTDDITPLIDLKDYVGTTENWETGLLSIDIIKTEGDKIYFLAGYTDKDINLSISLFDYDFQTGGIDKEKELFLSTRNGSEDQHNCGNIERINKQTWIFCVGDQDTLYALNENSIRTDLYSGKLIVFSMDDDFELLQTDSPSYNPDIFTPVGSDVRPKAVLASPPVKSSFEINNILALGFRNPWGFAVYDSHVFIPDVGLNKVEEINYLNLDSLEPKFYGWPHKEGDFYYAQDKVGRFWDYEVTPIYQHSSEEDRCANIGGAVHQSKALPGWNGYFFFLDQCTYEIFIINDSGETVFRATSEAISSPPVVVKNNYLGEILISTYTGEIFLLDLKSLDLTP